MNPRDRIDSLMSAYQDSLLILVAAKLGLFSALGLEARSAADLAAAGSLNERAVHQVLLALTAQGLLEQKAEGYFALQPDFAPFLGRDNDRSLLSILNHHYHCSRRWLDLAEVMRSGKPSAIPSSYEDPGTLRDFICGMADISQLSTQEVADKVDLAPFRRMLDLGGGPATSSIVLARRFPELECVVFDLPEVTAIAREQIAAANLADRITTWDGDFEVDELGTGFDLVYISNIIHSLAPEAVSCLLGKVGRALQTGGSVVLKDFFLDDTRTRPALAARFSVHMLVSTLGGRSYTMSETREMLSRHGFDHFSTTEIGKASALLMATKI